MLHTFYSITVYSKPSIKDLQRSKIITSIGPKWYELGIALLDEDKLPRLDIITSNHSEAIRRCTAMFNYWLQIHPNATWHELINTLESPGVELNNVATMVEELLSGKYPTMSRHM